MPTELKDLNEAWLSLMSDHEQDEAAADQWWAGATEEFRSLVMEAVSRLGGSDDPLSVVIGRLAQHEFMRLALKHCHPSQLFTDGGRP